jgi:glutaconate CoA-transferase, subunit B
VRRRNTEGYPASTSGRIVRRGEVETLRSVGHRYGGDSRKELGYRSAGPTIVITDLGILRPDPRTKELTLTALHPGVTVEEAKEATGWELKVAEELETTDPPTERELEILRDLKARSEASRKKT